MGVCYVQLGEYTEAQERFVESCRAMFEPPKKLMDGTFPDKLVVSCALSGDPTLYRSALDWLTAYKLTAPQSQANSPVASYCYAVMELLLGSEKNIAHHISVLLAKPKWKDMCAIGHAFQAIEDENQNAFNVSLAELLKVHEMKVKHGGLRYDGVDRQCLSLYAMSIGRVADLLGFHVNPESDYFSKGYLEFLRGCG
jgi:hypothetical protein